MKTIDVKEQPVLSFSRTTAIALAAVKYRMFRALVTVIVITVAMSFLMNILSESLIKRAVAETARDEIHNLHLADQWIAKLSIPQSRDEIIELLADNPAQSEVFAEMLAFSGMDVNADKMHELALEASDYLVFFKEVDFGKRRLLVGRSEGAKVFDYLSEPEHLTAFFDALSKMKTVDFPVSEDQIKAFLKDWPSLNSFCTAVRSGQQTALKIVQGQLKDETTLDALKTANGSFGDIIRKAGFHLSDADAATLSRQAQEVIDRHIIEDTINNKVIRRELAAEENILPAEVKVEMIWKLLLSQANASLYLDWMNQEKLSISDMTAERLVHLAKNVKRQRLLIRAELATTDSGTGFLGMGKRMTWLMFVSMLVCAVGIANAMLMSVTERFREIATLKCLGALDGFIMTVFLIESSILGLLGGVMGSLIGLIIGVLRMAVSFKSLMVQSIPVESLFIAGVISIGLGILLAALAAVYPSLRAAKLAPMEAMRIE